ncbi:MAG: tRNA lysidine(34) synthetase TilS [Gemmatimonadota bacterium]|nr:tRNA lysidine(34) synthetase TilS [Gemmatimonadota bacterium]
MLVALSGGGDSLALLHLLREAAGARRLELHAAHFDHGLRPDSAVTAARVAQICAELGVPIRRGVAGELTGGQAASRRARYAFLEREADACGADRIALAHQLDDQLETVLFRLVRGTGVRGLAGIPERRGPFVRPLLAVRRGELRDYLASRGEAWLPDPSNRDRRYARTRLRDGLLPALRGVCPDDGGSRGLDETLLRIAGDARTVDGVLDRRARRVRRGIQPAAAPGLADGGSQIAPAVPRDYDPAVLARILRIMARERDVRLSRRGTRRGVEFITRRSGGGSADVGGGLRLEREYERYRLVSADRDVEPDREVTIESPVDGSGTAKLGGRVYQVTWGGEAGDRSSWSVRLSTEALSFPLRLRAPRPGDRIRTPVGSRKLKKLLNERRVPRTERPRVPVLESADGRVLWVAGHETAVCPGRSGPPALFSVGVVPDESDGS